MANGRVSVQVAVIGDQYGDFPPQDTIGTALEHAAATYAFTSGCGHSGVDAVWGTNNVR